MIVEFTLCQMCKEKEAEHIHHMFSQSKVNIGLYGDLIHHPENIMILCSVCHLNKTVKKLTEIEFCQTIGIEPRSKEGKEIWKRLKN